MEWRLPYHLSVSYLILIMPAQVSYTWLAQRLRLQAFLLVGARKGKYAADGSVQAIPGANLPLATLGMFILWMGWFWF